MENGMKLLIDIGNTSAKLAVMGTDIVHFERRHESWKETFARLMAMFPINDVRLSTVTEEDLELQSSLGALKIPVIWLTSSVPCPAKPIVDIPATYGADRWAADIGAIVQDPDHTLLIIDAGTCITYDLFSADGRLLGGAISPGVQLRLNAMHEHTALLPQIEAEPEVAREYADLHVFITGGNTFHFADDIECPITFDPYLVMKGLAAL